MTERGICRIELETFCLRHWYVIPRLATTWVNAPSKRVLKWWLQGWIFIHASLCLSASSETWAFPSNVLARTSETARTYYPYDARSHEPTVLTTISRAFTSPNPSVLHRRLLPLDDDLANSIFKSSATAYYKVSKPSLNYKLCNLDIFDRTRQRRLRACPLPWNHAMIGWCTLGRNVFSKHIYHQ